MLSLLSQLDSAFRAAIQSSFGLDADPLLALSANPKFGDYQSNVAMSLSKTLAGTGNKTNPRLVAEKIKTNLKLGNLAEMEDISIAGPGFINIRLNPTWIQDQLNATALDPRLGIDQTNSPQTIVVDYSGPNIAKELHVGHLRSTIIGDAIARVLDFLGHRVIRQNHIGDWGTQFGMLIAYLRSLHIPHELTTENTESTETEDIKSNSPSVSSVLSVVQSPQSVIQATPLSDLEDFYKKSKARFDADPAFQDESRQTVVRLQAREPNELALWQAIVAETRNHYQPLYARLGVSLTQADERGESFYNPFLAEVVKELRERGIAVESEGAVVVHVPGYESPLIIEKTGGGYLYGTTDLAAIRYRINELHANRILYFTDSRQSQHFAQVFKAAELAGWTRPSPQPSPGLPGEGEVLLEHAPFGTMLGQDGKPFKTRTGGTVKLKELLDEAEERALKIVTDKNADLPEAQRQEIAHAVGIGAVKYSDLSKDRTSDYVFSWDQALAMDGNTAPYLQYVYARVRSIFRKSGGEAQTGRAANITLEAPAELALALHLLRLADVLVIVARELKPHYLCSYLYELATLFSGFYENCPVLKSDEPVRSSRLALCDLAARTMGRGLDLLGIDHPEQM
jgi:arginyl-tRNA synthetase